MKADNHYTDEHGIRLENEIFELKELLEKVMSMAKLGSGPQCHGICIEIRDYFSKKE